MSNAARKARKRAGEKFEPKAPNPRARRVEHPVVRKERMKQLAEGFRKYRALSPEAKAKLIEAAQAKTNPKEKQND